MTSIVIVAPSIGRTGGAERTAAMLVNALAKTGRFKVTICVTESKADEFSLEKNVEKEVLPTVEGINKNSRRVKALVNICKKRSAELLIGYTIIGGILACSSKIMLGNQIKVVVCERQDPHAFSWKYRLLRDVLYHLADGAVFQTTEAKNYFLKICKSSVVIPNLIDVEQLPAPSPFNSRKNTILSIGRLEKVKNHDLVIKAFSNISDKYMDWNLYIYGEGTEREYLEHLITELGLKDRVFLPGYEKHITDIMNKAKILVLASAYEGYPNALLEGMACGMLCIASDCPCGGPRDMIKNGRNGLLVKNMTVDSLSEILKTTLDRIDEGALMANDAIKIRDTNAINTIFNKWLMYFDVVVNS